MREIVMLQVPGSVIIAPWFACISAPSSLQLSPHLTPTCLLDSAARLAFDPLKLCRGLAPIDNQRLKFFGELPVHKVEAHWISGRPPDSGAIL